MSTQCIICGNCVENCQRCPQGCEYLTIFNLNKRRINRRVRMRSSLQLFQKKSAVVSRMVGQGATPSHLLQAGGPGDLISSVEQSAPRATRAARRSVTYNKGFSMGTSKNRLSCKGSVGVDKKHGSYARFLAHKTGGVLRKEQMPRVKQRKASIHQPRNRTGTAVPCCRPSHTTTTQRLKVTDVGPIVAACSNSVDVSGCCTLRIPQINTATCQLLAPDAVRWNSGNTAITGACGNNTQCVSSSRCRCCSNSRA